MIIYGINPILEALRAGRVKEIRVGERGNERAEPAGEQLGHGRG